MTEQLTKKQAQYLNDVGAWWDWTDEQVVRFQLFQKKLAMPSYRFHEALEVVLKRGIYLREYSQRDKLCEEYLQSNTMPTFQEIIQMIPEDKRFIIEL